MTDTLFSLALAMSVCLASATISTPLYGLGRVYEHLGDIVKSCDYYQRYASSNGRDAQNEFRVKAQQFANNCVITEIQ